MRIRRILLAAVGSTLAALPAAAAVTRLEFLGEARVAGGTQFEDMVVGGLSGITYDATRDLYLVVADDPSARAPARFFDLEIDFADGRLEEGDAAVVGVTVLRSADGGPFPSGSVDPEGIALHPDGSLFISSEGQIRHRVAPFVSRFARDGVFLEELALPDRYKTGRGEGLGPRHNLGFESLTLTPDGRYLFTVLENALVEDGPEAALGVPSPSRLLKYDLDEGRPASEHLYWAEPVAVRASVPDGLEVAGVVEMLALDDQTLLSLERSFSMGVGNTIQLFLVQLEGASDLSAIPALRDADLSSLVAVRKQLLLDLAELGIYLDNLEGMTFGPPLGDGRQSVILVSDDNFNPLIQKTQLLAFAIDRRAVDIEGIQGAAHRSPLSGQWVLGVEGIVTASYPEEPEGFWMEAASRPRDPARSGGVLVLHDPEMEAATPGDRVRIDGRVEEGRRPGDLGTTTLRARRIEVLDSGLPLPPPIVLGKGGSRVPSEVVEDDGMRHFEPRFDGLDFWESLEGMRVALTDAVVVGPTDRYGDLVVDASGRPGSATSRAGGLLLRPGDLNPERLIVDFSAFESPPRADVGAILRGKLTGVVGYRFSSYRLYALPPLPTVSAAGGMPETTELLPTERRLTLVTFNVRNLSAVSDANRFRSLAETLIRSMGAPDVVALQEIQDDTGPIDDGTVSATATLQKLLAEIALLAGPAYEIGQIDPVNNQDGGQPGANIRVVFLFNPARVSLVERGSAGPLDAVQVVASSGAVGLSANPGRLEPTAAAFNEDEARGFSASRKPLVAEFQFGHHRLFVVNNHWSSKSADDRTFGDIQPPVHHSEDQRSQQARWVSDFVTAILAAEPRAAVAVLGDFNDHEFRAPLRILTATPLENLVFQLPPEDRYTFNYRGNSQLLDHVLVSPSLVGKTRLDIVHVNADLADGRGSSDHDPIVLAIEFGSGD